MTATILIGDCREKMAEMDAGSVRAMSLRVSLLIASSIYTTCDWAKEWDHGVPGPPFWTDALRVAKPFPGSHFATFPPGLIEPCIKAGCPEDGLVLDPFMGSGTTLMVACRLGRRGIGIELNPEYAAMAKGRIDEVAPLFNDEAVVG